MDANIGHSSIGFEDSSSRAIGDQITASDVVRTQEFCADSDVGNSKDSFPDVVGEWCDQYFMDALRFRKEAVGWWREFAGCIPNVEYWTRKQAHFGQIGSKSEELLRK